MGEGWENARRRGGGNDWALFKLAARGEPTLIEVDTSYFIGNAPGKVRVRWPTRPPVRSTTPTPGGTSSRSTPVLVDTRHRFLVGVRRAATHLRLDVYPDGGLTRLRCFGELRDSSRYEMYQRFWDVLPAEHQQFLETMPVPPSEAAPADEV